MSEIKEFDIPESRPAGESKSKSAVQKTFDVTWYKHPMRFITTAILAAGASQAVLPAAYADGSNNTPDIAQTAAQNATENPVGVDLRPFYQTIGLVTVPGTTTESEIVGRPDINPQFKKVQGDGSTLYPTYNEVGKYRGDIIVKNGVVIFEAEVIPGSLPTIDVLQNDPNVQTLGTYEDTIKGYDFRVDLGPTGKMLIYDKAALSVKDGAVVSVWGYVPMAKVDFLKQWGGFIQPANGPKKA